jgi:hypothetical protein
VVCGCGTEGGRITDAGAAVGLPLHAPSTKVVVVVVRVVVVVGTALVVVVAIILVVVVVPCGTVVVVVVFGGTVVVVVLWIQNRFLKTAWSADHAKFVHAVPTLNIVILAIR